MQMLISTLLLAVLLPAPDPDPQPTCRAQLHGPVLTTSITFRSGLALQAPWRVMETRRAWISDTESTMVVDLALDAIEELDDLTGERKKTRLGTPVHVTVQGDTQAEVVYNAAQTWCSTVIQVRRTSDASAPALLRPAHIT